VGPSNKPEVIAAIPTAFDAGGGLDVDGCRSIIEHLSSSELDGFFVTGTAGEFASLSRSERRLVATLAVESVPDDKRLVLHVGAASAHEVLALLEDARECGVRHVAVITPYFLPTDRETMREFYRQVSLGADELEVYPYLYRQVTGNGMDEHLLAEIASFPHVAGAKISGESPDRIAHFVEATPADFPIYAGADQELVEMHAHGARGVVSAMSACLPRPFTRLAAAVASGQVEEVARWQAQVDDICGVIAGDIGRTKAALRLQGVAAGQPRMAMAPPDEATAAEIARIVELYA